MTDIDQLFVVQVKRDGLFTMDVIISFQIDNFLDPYALRDTLDHIRQYIFNHCRFHYPRRLTGSYDDNRDRVITLSNQLINIPTFSIIGFKCENDVYYICVEVESMDRSLGNVSYMNEPFTYEKFYELKTNQLTNYVPSKLSLAFNPTQADIGCVCSISPLELKPY